ncbi:conjugative transfer protein MobI(A/C) (plasmid) [Xanthomonas sontii]|uniref:conjugative transfer protein MobI(A/C) n=1 Tax=Xanthomonas sontii TaxID=2650745 RepID=UPI003F84803A
MSQHEQQPLPNLATERLSSSADIITRQIMVMEAMLETEAKDLCTAFTKARTEIQRSMGEITSRAEFKERFAPLVMHSRVNKGSLEITWSLQKGVTKPGPGGKGRRILDYLPKGKGFSYKLPDLMSLSRDYELMLVVDAERKATRLREMWSKVVALRVDLRAITRLCSTPGDAMVPPGREAPGSEPASSAVDQSLERMVASEEAVLSHEFDKTNLGAMSP